MEANFKNSKDFHFNYASELNIEGLEDAIVFMTIEDVSTSFNRLCLDNLSAGEARTDDGCKLERSLYVWIL